MLGIALAFASTAPAPAASALSAPAQLRQLLMNAERRQLRGARLSGTRRRPLATHFRAAFSAKS